MAETVDIADVITTGIAAKLKMLHVAIPGVVVKYAKDRADVLPAVKRSLETADGSRVFEALPTLPQLPVLWPRLGDFALRGKLTAGDTGLLVFASTPWGEWLDTGEISEPVEVRGHSIGYAAFWPGLFSNAKPITEDEPISGAMLTIGAHDNSGAAIGFKSGEIMAGAGGEALVKASAFATWAGKVETALNSAGFPVSPLWNVGTNNATTILKGK